MEGLTRTATIPVRGLINIERLSRLESQTFVTGMCALTMQSPTIYQLSYQDWQTCELLYSRSWK